MYTWEQANAELGRLMGDTLGSKLTWSNELRLDAYNAALAAFAIHTAVASSFTWAADGELSKIDIPDNAVEGLAYLYLWNESDLEWWKPVRITAGASAPDPTPNRDNVGNSYYEWPTGTIQLTRTPAISSFTGFYYAYYDSLVDDDSEIEVPVWARQALLDYAAAYCMHKSAVERASIAQWNQKQDSGNPEHNPFERRQKAFLEEYQRILGAHNPQQKAPPRMGARD